jgi:diguanylate cyclase (GGDEF)-like protein
VSRRPSRRLRGTSGAAIAGGVRGRTDLQARVEVAEAVAELSHWALRADQPDELLREALRVAVDVIGADYGTAVRRLSDGRMRVAHETGPDPFPTGTVLTLAPERSYVLHVVESGEPFVSADLRRDPRVTPPVPLLERGVVSGLAVPVRGGHSVLGVLALHSRHRRRFGRQDVAAATALASVVATAWEQVAQRARLGHQALHDPLTGLGNRVLFLDRLEHALTRRPAGPGEQAAGVAVMLLDLDDFKAVNDSFGHAAGDRLLTVAAHRFDAIIRPEDTIARLGGDEFGVLCEDVADAATAAALAARLQAACAAPVVVSGASLTFSASIGVTWTGRAAARPGTGGVLLAEADAALYRAKDQGRGQSQVFDERLSRATRHRRQLEGELKAALDAGEFRLHYQPVRRADDLHAVGVEALLRWQHPSHGLLSPDEFLPTAEQMGLLRPLGQWVLFAACEQVARWQEDPARKGTPLWLAVNVSPRQLDDPGLPDAVAEALESSALAEGTLALELTESALMSVDGHGEVLTRLRETGARLFLDDFGTGYSSLTHLTQLPISAVKIDKSFVAGVSNEHRQAAVVSALVALSRELGIDVIAEGVETPAQLQALQHMDCRAVQGFLFDRPAAKPSLRPVVGASLSARSMSGRGKVQVV